MRSLTRAEQQVVMANLGLVRMVAHDFRDCAELDDLKQVGCIGLMKAVRRFRPELGNAFSSFAVPYIRGEIQHYLRDRIPLIRPTRGKAPETVLRLDVRVGFGEIATLADLIEGRTQPTAIQELHEAIDTLEPSLQTVIRLHLEGYKQKEIATHLGKHPMTIARWLNKAKQLLRAILNSP